MKCPENGDLQKRTLIKMMPSRKIIVLPNMTNVPKEFSSPTTTEKKVYFCRPIERKLHAICNGHYLCE